MGNAQKVENSLEFVDPRVKILVVEDDIADMALIADCAESAVEDCDISKARTMRDAYKQCSEKDFNVILLDLNLPDGYGISSVSDIKKVCNGAPIIVLTGMASQITIDEALKAGAAQVILKVNINISGLGQAISEHL